MAESVEDMMKRLGMNWGELQNIAGVTEAAAPTHEVRASLTETLRAPDREREAKKLRRAMQEAEKRNLVTVEQPFQENGLARGYLFLSDHYGIRGQGEHEAKRSQLELVRLCEILRNEEIWSPLFVEGLTDGIPLTVPSEFRLDPATSSDEQILSAFDRVNDVFRKTGRGSPPVFYMFTNYPNIRGARGARAHALQEQLNAWDPWHRAFAQRFAPLLALKPDQEKLVQARGRIVDGGRTLETAGCRFDMRILLNDMRTRLRMADLIAQYQVACEEELPQKMVEASPATVPCAWAGYGHRDALLKALSPQMDIAVVVPRTFYGRLRSGVVTPEMVSNDDTTETNMARSLLASITVQ